MKKIIFIMLALAMTAGVSAQQKGGNRDVDNIVGGHPEAQAAINNIMTRTSIRQYTDEPVSKADIETMLRAGMAAPTAVNRQPWHFVAVTDKAKLSELAGQRGGMIKQAGVAIGHPAEQPTPKDKWKPENVSYNEFGGKAE